MTGRADDPHDLVKESLLYKEFLAEREEILRHKWIQSEQAGHDIGFEKALLDWIYLGVSPRTKLSQPPPDIDLGLLNTNRLKRLAQASGLQIHLKKYLSRVRLLERSAAEG